MRDATATLKRPSPHACAGGLGQTDELFKYLNSASGEWFQHVTSMERVVELAKTHPLVSTISANLENLVEDRELDERGYAKKGDQSNFFLSLSLAVSGKVMNVGISTRHSEASTSFFGLWWRPKGPDEWSEIETEVAREVFYDLMELDADRVRAADEAASGAPAGAASGAPASGAPEATTEREPEPEPHCIVLYGSALLCVAFFEFWHTLRLA